MELDVFLKSFNESDWKSYLEVCRKMNIDYKTELGGMILPEDIALVLCYRFGERQAAKWLHTQVPILENVQPKELLGNEQGKNILKEILLRMPD